jgi:hypothetical protein
MEIQSVSTMDIAKQAVQSQQTKNQQELQVTVAGKALDVQAMQGIEALQLIGSASSIGKHVNTQA